MITKILVEKFLIFYFCKGIKNVVENVVANEEVNKTISCTYIKARTFIQKIVRWTIFEKHLAFCFWKGLNNHDRNIVANDKVNYSHLDYN